MVTTRRAPYLRSIRGWFLRTSRRLSLSQRFLIAAILVVAMAMAALGNWVGVYLQQGITNGVVDTAAASIEALITHQVGEITSGSTLTVEQRASLDAAFRIGNEADQTRLLQIRIRDLDGGLIYESSGGLVEDGEEDDELAAAARGGVTARIIDVLLAPVGPIEGLPLTVLEIFTPLHRVADGTVFATAELYYSAATLIELRDKAQRDVWVLVGLFGILVVSALYLLVNSANRTISRQRGRLAANLAASRRLTDENRALRDAADQLRLSANSANEALLAQVGSDIHDGPLQLLTLIILRLGRGAKTEADLAPTIQLASETMEELRNISTGLVLPELADTTLEQALALAVQRHEDQTGTTVERVFGELDGSVIFAVKIAAYRVVQEALTNAFRHGGGIGQVVEATIENGALLLTIENEAVEGSVSTEGDRSNMRLGLKGMRFRVESLGGELSIAFDPRHTRVSAKIPLGWTGLMPDRRVAWRR